MEGADEQRSKEAGEEEKGPVVAAVAFGTVVTAALSAISFLLLPLIGRQAGPLGFLAVLPLLATVGTGLGMTYWSVNVGDWKIFSTPRWRFAIIVGLPLLAVAFLQGDAAILIAGVAITALGLIGIKKLGGVGLGLRKSWMILLLAIAVGIVVSLVWLRFCNQDGPAKDIYGCLVGEETWCEYGEKCVRPWENFCGASGAVDAFNILKKLKGFSGWEMDAPVSDEFSWFEEQGENLIQLSVSGMTAHTSGGDLATLDRIFTQADFTPDEVNTNTDGAGGLRGYRMKKLHVCTVTYVEPVTGEAGSLSISISCGRLDGAIAP